MSALPAFSNPRCHAPFSSRCCCVHVLASTDHLTGSVRQHLRPRRRIHSLHNQITVTNTHISFGETKNGATIAVLGEIRNNSPVPWKEINLHAHFTDTSGRTIDVATEDKYSFHLPAHSTSQFKLSFRREFPETNYAHHTIRVLSAKDSRSRW